MDPGRSLANQPSQTHKSHAQEQTDLISEKKKRKKKGGERLRKTPRLTSVLYIHVCTRAHTHMNIYIHLAVQTCKKNNKLASDKHLGTMIG